MPINSVQRTHTHIPTRIIQITRIADADAAATLPISLGIHRCRYHAHRIIAEALALHQLPTCFTHTQTGLRLHSHTN